MNIKFNLKRIWLAVGIFSLILLGFHWFGYDSNNLQNTILALNVLVFALSLPCSLFIIPVVIVANHFMAISPVSGEGIYLNTIFLFVIGAMQWFWIANFWSPTEPSLQMLDLPNDDRVTG